MEQIVFIVYSLISLVLLVYSTVEFSLLLNFLFRKKRNRKRKWDELPHVTIQLPLYNESYVVERLIDAVVKIEYPKEKLEIQVLDDSNDDTVEKAAQKVAFYREKGFDIMHVRREDRVGFKAGALDYGLKSAKGEFIAIFDADFLPDSQFLLDGIQYFHDEKVGVVQTRWTYVNEGYSLLTKVQTIMLNTHFSVEQSGRNKSGAYINFNGTAGIWRRDCIDDAGGWEADTLTEDLDLSFRAQMRGWKFSYVRDIESPSELPITLPGYKAQQFRWSKGAAECARKNIPSLLRSKMTSSWAKWVGVFHLLNSSVYLLVLSFILLSFPIAYSLHQLPEGSWIFQMIPLFLVSNFLLFCVFIGGNLVKKKLKWYEVPLFPLLMIVFLILNMGISLYMAIGILEGYAGKKSEFVRTPKFNVKGRQAQKEKNRYARIQITPLLILEVLFIAYGVFQIIYASSIGDLPAIIFASMFTLGFSYNVATTVYHSALR